MRALCKTETGVELRSLQPSQPGPGEVVIKVMCAGLCRTDIYVAQGDLSSELPRTLGHECSGVICRLGEGDVDWDKVRVALKEIGFSGWATREGSDRSLEDTSKLIDELLIRP